MPVDEIQTSAVVFSEHDLQIARNLPRGRNPSSLYLAQLGPGSLRTMTEALHKLARLVSDGRLDADVLPWHALRAEHTSALRDRLAGLMAPATANKHLAALRGVMKQARLQGLLSDEDYHRAIDVRAVPRTSTRSQRTLSPAEHRALLDACDRDPTLAGARDAALIALLSGAGLRRSEVVSLDAEDYDRTTGVLRVRGQGSRRARHFTANGVARDAMVRWLDRRGDAPGPMFNPVNKGGRLDLRRLSEQAIYVACRKRSLEIGIPPASPEDLRRSSGGSRAHTSRPAADAPPGEPPRFSS